MGLNGLLFYEIQSPTSTPSTTKDSVLLTSGSVVGNRHDTHALEMDYLDTVNGKVVYFPAYACTSFLAGQVMHAHLHKISDLRPHPTRDGFTVLFAASAGSPTAPTFHEHKTDNRRQSFLQLEDFVDEDEEHRVAELLKSFSSGDLCQMLSLDDAEDPHFSDLFVRQATLPSSEDSPNRRSSLNDLYDAKEEGDSSLETVESLGIFTPPLGSSVDVTLGTNDVNRHRKPAVDPDLPSFLDLSYEDVDAGRTDQISNVGSGHKICQPVRTVK
ncbi:hypothetical protein NLJ89_g11025 [Agrocybe chaxingu]|uniref:Uncharacterized protein n=1 Tax=Agrocybe chaxingu TaxID=84603 RepID=A0A9W8JX25_9AGAR|nr:hypothetical protein NLJ89_g11025 [Agrocybe chaxingu]